MKKYEITKAQIRLIEHQSVNMDYGQVARDMREWFPDAFKRELVSGWVKHKDGMHPDWLWYVNFETGDNYGFMDNGEFSDSAKDQLEYVKGRCEQATKSEVLKALKKECIKLGLVEGVMIKSFRKCYNYSTLSDRKAEYNKINNQLYLGGCLVFDNGKWQSPVKTITKKDAQERLNCIIID